MLYNEGKNNWENIIHNNINQEALYSYYIGNSIKIGQAFNSPLREDKVPSFSIYKNNNGELMYKDHMTGESGDIIKFTMHYFNFSRRMAVIKCLSDAFRTILSNDLLKITPKYTYQKKNVSIGIKTINFSISDIEYWNQFYISLETLNKYHVVAVSHVWVNDKLLWVRTPKEPIYAYLVEGKIKIYRPYSERKSKWIANTTNDLIFGEDNLPWIGEQLIITKALKDVMVLHTLGYNSISPNGETTLLTNEQITQLKNRFKNITVLLDNDAAGINAANKYKSNYNLNIVFLPGKDKDISDYIKNNGMENTISLLSKLIKC